MQDGYSEEAYVYAIATTAGDRVYIGSTNNPTRRLMQHNSGDGHWFTAEHRPWHTLLRQRCANRAEAKCIEREWTRRLRLRLPMPFETDRVKDYEPKYHHDHFDGPKEPRARTWQEPSWRNTERLDALERELHARNILEAEAQRAEERRRYAADAPRRIAMEQQARLAAEAWRAQSNRNAAQLAADKIAADQWARWMRRPDTAEATEKAIAEARRIGLHLRYNDRQRQTLELCFQQGRRVGIAFASPKVEEVRHYVAQATKILAAQQTRRQAPENKPGGDPTPDPNPG
jgi:predicted GIY-YIG superfamily endonuclease